MQVLTLTVFLALITIAIIFGAIALSLYYHIGRYSYLGDFSKRMFLIYITLSLGIITVTFVEIVLNHLFHAL